MVLSGESEQGRGRDSRHKVLNTEVWREKLVSRLRYKFSGERNCQVTRAAVNRVSLEPSVCCCLVVSISLVICNVMCHPASLGNGFCVLNTVCVCYLGL